MPDIQNPFNPLARRRNRMDGDGGTRRDEEESDEPIDLQELPDADEGYDYLDNGDTLSDMKDEIDSASNVESGEDEGPRVTKPYVTRFIEGYPVNLQPTTEIEVGLEWDGDAPEDFVEVGWLDLNRRVTSKGAAVVDTAKSVIAETGGGSSGLKAYLNTEGIEGFFDRVRRENDVELDHAP